MPLEITLYDVFKSDGWTDGRMDATKRIISLASRSIIIRLVGLAVCMFWFLRGFVEHNYVVHHFNGTEIHCPPWTCVVHHCPNFSFVEECSFVLIRWWLIAPSSGPYCNEQLKTSFTNLKNSFIYPVPQCAPHIYGTCMYHCIEYLYSYGKVFRTIDADNGAISLCSISQTIGPLITKLSSPAETDV